MAKIDRTDIDALVETQVADEIFQGVVKESKALSKKFAVQKLRLKWFVCLMIRNPSKCFLDMLIF